MRVVAKLPAKAGRGWTLKRGTYTGELDDRGVFWVEVSKVPRTSVGPRVPWKVGIRDWEYVEDEDKTAQQEAAAVLERRAPVLEKIKAANAAREARR